MTREPALLGGPPVFAAEIPINRPTTPPIHRIEPLLREVFESGMVTNDRQVRSLETEARDLLGVEDAVAVSNCTSGLMLIWRVLDLKGPVALPSFTFPATAHALTWNGLDTIFLDCEKDTFTISKPALEAAVRGGARAVSPVYVFGNAPDWPALESASGGLPMVSDAAHALGTEAWGRKAGSFGLAEVFSLAPTKVVVACEGGIVATRDRALAAELRVARNYGNPGNYDCRWVGLNARMSEPHAVIARLSLEECAQNVARREVLARAYRQGLSDLPGIGFQTMPPEVRTNWNYFAILVDGDAFGLTSKQLGAALVPEKVMTRRYFHPPVHTQKPYRDLPGPQPPLPNTQWVCDHVLCLPMYSHLELSVVEEICRVIRRIHARADAVRARLQT
jgi:dTDP-4-amino-4,6-dideoxygalactose transaminase